MNTGFPDEKNQPEELQFPYRVLLLFLCIIQRVPEAQSACRGQVTRQPITPQSPSSPPNDELWRWEPLHSLCNNELVHRMTDVPSAAARSRKKVFVVLISSLPDDMGSSSRKMEIKRELEAHVFAAIHRTCPEVTLHCCLETQFMPARRRWSTFDVYYSFNSIQICTRRLEAAMSPC